MAAGCLTLLAFVLTASQPVIVGHRGTGSDRNWNPYPENTLESIQRAFAEGANLVEIDISLDSRGAPIVWHDEMVTIGGREVPVRSVPHEDMPLLVGPTGMAAAVPSFADALRLALTEGCCRKVLLVELKVHCPADRQLLAAAVVDELRLQRALDRVIVASTDAAVLGSVERLAPGIETGFFAIGPRQAWRQVRNMLGRQPTTIDWILVRQRFGFSRFSQTRLVRRAHRKGLRAGVWTVNRPINMRRFQRKGFDMIITDEPDVARRVRR